MDSQSKADLIFYGGLALVFFLFLRNRANSSGLTWKVDPATGNLVPASPLQSDMPLLTQINQTTNEPLVSSDIANNSNPNAGSALVWTVDPITGLLKPTATGPGTWGGISGSW